MSASDSATPPAVKKRGCLFWVLVSGLVSVVVLGVGGYVGYGYAKHRVVLSYTEATPIELPEAALSPADLGELDGRVAAFVHALRNKNPVEPLVLTGEELTAFADRVPGLRRLGGHARFSIADGEVRSDLSAPLERVGYPGRWFNGSAAFAVSLDNGVLVVTLRSASVRGNPIPGWIVDTLHNRNLAGDLSEKPEIAGLIARLESIEVGDGKLTLVPRLRL